MLQHHAVPRTELFSHTRGGAPFVDLWWLSEVVTALAGNSLGWGGILLVAAVRSVESEGATLEEGIRAGLQQRLRAILASTLTGALGALPMAINPGPGSVIYRGLAAVNIGGVVVSLAFSLVLIPALMRLLARRRHTAAMLGASRAAPVTP